MMLRQFVTLAVFVAVLVLAPWMWASGAEVARVEREAVSANLASLNVAHNRGLASRNDVRKRPAEKVKFEPTYEPEFVVKFRDSVRARTSNEQLNRVVSRGGANLDSFQAIVDQYGLTVRPHFNMSEERLSMISARAEGRSGRVQPDLAGILRVTGPASVIERAAREINALQIVEFVEFTGEIDPDLSELKPGNHVQVAQQQPAHREQPRVWDGQMTPHDTARLGTPPRPGALHTDRRDLNVDTGRLQATAVRGQQGAQVVFSRMVEVEDVPWIRLFFRDVTLSGSRARGNASYIVVTSLITGESQKMDAAALHQWSYATAYFRGGSLLVQVFAYPGTGDNQLVIDRAEYGQWVGGMVLSVCDTDDDRVQTNDPAVGRIMSGGGMCTGFLFDGNESCMLTAGHCIGAVSAGGATVHFNVPDSLPDGTPVPSAVVDQFPILVDSVQFEPAQPCSGGLVACGSDWALFGMGLNPADQTALQWQGFSHTLATSIPGVSNDPDDIFEERQIIVRGYGSTTDTNAPNSWNATQTSGQGEMLSLIGSTLIYRADTTGGTSGGPVIDVETGLVIGVHTCGGCLPFGGGANLGTAVTHQNLPHAFANPNACEEDVQGATGACCVSGVCFNTITASDCAANGGTFRGVGTECPTGPLYGSACNTTYLCCSPGNACIPTTYWECEAICGTVLNIYGVGDYVCDDDDPFQPCQDDPACGAPTAGDCFTPRFTTHCNNEDLCEDVCDIDPFCCDPNVTFNFRGSGRWDEICVWHARRLTGQEVHPCFVSTGDCESPNDSPGCDNLGCCLTVCIASPACCGDTYRWDPHCVQLAAELCALGSPDGPTPDFSRAQGYLTPEGYIEQFGTFPVGVAGGLGPWGFNFPLSFDPTGFAYDYKANLAPLFGWGGEGFDIPGLREFGDLFEGPNGTGGLGIRIGVLYPTAFVHPTDESQTHEDLRGRVIYPEVDQTLIINPTSPSGLLDGNVGTAVLGILAANPDNNSGMTAMVPDAEVYYFPTVSVEQGGRFQNAFLSALNIFEAGDVILIPYTSRAVFTPMTSTALGYTLVSVAIDLGISCVIAAGDNNGPISPQAGEVDSGVFIVGAVMPGLPYGRLGFSNGCLSPSDTPCDDLLAVHTSAWGSGVATLGFGDLFLGRTGGQEDLMRSYTVSFGGTAASSAQIAATVAMMQGLAKQFWGIPLAPIQIRGELSLSGFCQWGYCLGSTDGPPGEGGEFPGFGDWDLGSDPLWVGSMAYNTPQFADQTLLAHMVFPDLPAVAEWIVAEGYFDGCDIEQVHTVRGTHRQGNVWSVCSLDANYYVAQSMQTSTNSGPSNSIPEWGRELNKVAYAATGQIADVVAVARTTYTTATVLTVQAVGNTSDGRPSVAFIELFDWETRNWVIAGVNYNGGGGVFVDTFPFLGAEQYVRNSDRAVLVRVWVYGLPIPGGFGDSSSNHPFDLRLDLIDINIGGFIDKN